MKILTVGLLVLTLLSCKHVDRPNDVEQVYLLNRNKNLSIFKNWDIYYRDGKNNVILFDYYNKEVLEYRYIVAQEDSIIIRELHPNNKLPFYNLEDSDSSNTNQLSYSQYKKFLDLEVDFLSYRYADDLFIIKKNSSTLIYKNNNLKEKGDTLDYENYIKIDSNWYYYNREEE